MINTLNSEWIKLRTVLVHWVLAIIAVAFPIIVVVLVAIFGTFDSSFESSELSGLIVGVTIVSAMLFGAMSAISITSEYGHSTIRPTYAATPNRMRVIGSKLILNTVAVGAAVALAVAISWVAASLILSARDASISIGDDEVIAPLISVIVLAMSVTWFGLGLGLIIRNSPATITILLLWPLLIEGLLGFVLSLIGWDDASKWMPYQAAINAAAESEDSGLDMLGRPMGLIYFAAVSLALVVIGAALDQRRDA